VEKYILFCFVYTAIWKLHHKEITEYVFVYTFSLLKNV